MQISIIRINWKIVPLAIIRMSLAYVYGATKYNEWVMSHPFDPHLFVLFGRYTICDIQALFSPMSNGGRFWIPTMDILLYGCVWVVFFRGPSLEVVSIAQFQRHIPLVDFTAKKNSITLRNIFLSNVTVSIAFPNGDINDFNSINSSGFVSFTLHDIVPLFLLLFLFFFFHRYNRA